MTTLTVAGIPVGNDRPMMLIGGRSLPTGIPATVKVVMARLS